MAWYSTFLEKLFPVKERYGADASAVVIDIPGELYYKELALYTVTNLIGNAISRSEFRCYERGKPTRNSDYYRLNVSPNRNETSSAFWHKVINKVIRSGEALVVEVGGYLYCADSFVRVADRPVLGDVYGHVTLGSFTFQKRFGQEDSYLMRLDNISGRALIDGMYGEYGAILSAAAKDLKSSYGRKYKLHIDGVKAGDDEFNQEFENYISEQLKTYMESSNAVYPEFDGYKLEADPNAENRAGSAEDFLKLKKDIFETVANIYHIPGSMMSGNINDISDVVSTFLTFGVDPFADMITEALNKVAGPENMLAGNYYSVDTSRIMHMDAFSVAADISNLISSGVKSIDEVRAMLGDEPLDTEWSRMHFITKNFEEIAAYTSGKGDSGE